MDVTTIYFSQTGHTRTVARAMAEAIREKGHTARTVPLREATPQDAATGDVLAMGTPCFSSQAPTPVKAFLRSLRPLSGKRSMPTGPWATSPCWPSTTRRSSAGSAICSPVSGSMRTRDGAQTRCRPTTAATRCAPSVPRSEGLTRGVKPLWRHLPCCLRSPNVGYVQVRQDKD